MMRQFFHLNAKQVDRAKEVSPAVVRRRLLLYGSAVHRGLAEDAVNGLGGNLHRCCGCKLISTSTTTTPHNDTVGKVESGDSVASSDKVGHLLTDKLDDQGNAVGKHQLLTDVLKLVDVVQLVVLQQQQQNRRDGLDDNLLVPIEVNLQSQRVQYSGCHLGRGRRLKRNRKKCLAHSERVAGNVLLSSHLHLTERLVEVLLQNVHRSEDGRGQTGGRLAKLAVRQRVADKLLAHLRQKDRAHRIDDSLAGAGAEHLLVAIFGQRAKHVMRPGVLYVAVPG
ncbi:hypothetical protein TYRP_023704 [Tyrophagus putrescentiae]|nr:hypothetical protein TYRP_023704 [Tyrophagus putrescentiae]